ncbi:MAG: virulence factor TspB C-terminal domain-related protein, partial [Methylobacter sp.]
YSAQQAKDAALQKAEEAQIAATEESQARVKAMDLDNQLTPEQRAQAELDFSGAAKKSVAAETKAQNSKDAAKAAETAAGNAGDASTQAGQSTNPGNAEVWSGWADEYNKQAGVASGDAQSGEGSGTGSGTGSQDGLGTDTDKIVGAIDGLGQKIADKKTDCEQDSTRAGCSQLGDAPTADAVPNSDASGITSGSFSSTSWGSSGTCPSDTTSKFSTQSIVFSYEPVCNYLSGLAPVLIALSFVGAGRIVLGSVQD